MDHIDRPASGCDRVPVLPGPPVLCKPPADCGHCRGVPGGVLHQQASGRIPLPPPGGGGGMRPPLYAFLYLCGGCRNGQGYPHLRNAPLAGTDVPQHLGDFPRLPQAGAECLPVGQRRRPGAGIPAERLRLRLPDPAGAGRRLKRVAVFALLLRCGEFQRMDKRHPGRHPHAAQAGPGNLQYPGMPGVSGALPL